MLEKLTNDQLGVIISRLRSKEYKAPLDSSSRFYWVLKRVENERCDRSIAWGIDTLNKIKGE